MAAIGGLKVDEQTTAIRAAAATVNQLSQIPAGSAGVVEWSRSITEQVLDLAAPRAGMEVLDVACGSGDPALALAGRVEPGGRVIATDPSSEYLAAARRRLKRLGLRNLELRRACAESLPFRSGTFDLLTCMCGIAFFTDTPRAMSEMHRVLKPGGRVVLASWGDCRASAVYQSTIGVVARHVGSRPPDPDVPDPYGWNDPRRLSTALAQAGFSALTARSADVRMIWTDSEHALWRLTRASNPLLRSALLLLAPAQRSSVEGEVLASLARYREGSRLSLPARIVLASGTRDRMLGPVSR